MKTSESITNIAKALIVFHDNVGALSFNASVSYGTTKFKYADLAEVMKVIKPALVKAKLAVSQVIDTVEGISYVTTILMHESGDYISGSVQFHLGTKAQDAGSYITYMRRYSLCALLGLVADEDNDAQNESPVTPVTKAPVPTPMSPKIKPVKPMAQIPITETTKPIEETPKELSYNVDLKTFIDQMRDYKGDIDNLILRVSEYIEANKLSVKQKAWLDKEYESKLIKLGQEESSGEPIDEIPF